MCRVKVAEQLPGLVDTHGKAKLRQILDRIAAPPPLSRRKQTNQATLRRKGLR